MDERRQERESSQSDPLAELRLHRARAEAVAELPHHLPHHTEREFHWCAIEAVRRLTESRAGFLFEIGADANSVERLASARDVGLDRSEAGTPDRLPIEELGEWATPVTSLEPWIRNSPPAPEALGGLPDWVESPNRLLSVPVRTGSHVVLLVTVCGRETDYRTDDVGTIQLLGSQVWQLTRLGRSTPSVGDSRSLLDQIASIARVGGWSIDCETREMTWTRDAFELLGLPPGTPPDLEAVFSCFEREDREKLRAALERALMAGEPYDLTLRLNPRGRDPIWVRTSCHSEVVEGRPRRLLGVIRDVTLEQESRRSLGGERRRERQAAARAVSIREEERANLARELHDGMGQLLTAMRMDLALLGVESAPEEDVEPGTLQSVVALVERTLMLTQDISARLREPILDDIGLVPALRSYLREFQLRAGVTCDLTPELLERPVSSEVALAAYRIVQEATTNVARHSRAARLSVRLDHDGNTLTIVIEDDGIGIDPDASVATGTLGIRGMRDRARALGGRLEVAPLKEGGTRVVAHLPVDPLPPM